MGNGEWGLGNGEWGDPIMAPVCGQLGNQFTGGGTQKPSREGWVSVT